MITDGKTSNESAESDDANIDEVVVPCQDFGSPVVKFPRKFLKLIKFFFFDGLPHLATYIFLIFP
jgi:hypothetical protein